MQKYNLAFFCKVDTLQLETFYLFLIVLVHKTLSAKMFLVVVAYQYPH